MRMKEWVFQRVLNVIRIPGDPHPRASFYFSLSLFRRLVSQHVEGRDLYPLTRFDVQFFSSKELEPNNNN